MIRHCWWNRGEGDRSATRFRFARWRRRLDNLSLCDRAELGNETCGSTRHIAESMEFLTVRREHNDGGNARNVKTFLEGLISLQLKMANRLVAGKISFNQYEFGAGKIGEFRLIEDFAFQF